MAQNGTTPDGEEEEMNYAVVGGEGATGREQLEKYTGVVEWAYLLPHFHSGALLYVDPGLEITSVGEAIANDDAKRVSAWKQGGDLLSPSQPHADYWEESSQQFRALVVSPFVLIQPVEEGENPAGKSP
ncbi:MAG: DUF2288 domain-containing protein [Verrucomicrobiota bacterium]